MANIFESSDGNRGINPNGMYTGGMNIGGIINLKDYVVKPTTSTFDTLKIDQIIFGMQCKKAPCPSGEVSSNNSIENNGEVKGKYMFIKDYTASTCSQYAGSMGIINPCVEYKYYNYKKGDVIDAQTFYVNAVKLPIKEQNLSVPMSYLKKVSDDTPLSKENISFGKTYIDNSKTEKNDEVLQSAEIKTVQNGLQQSFLEKHKTHLLILGGVVLIYLVYKKNKKWV